MKEVLKYLGGFLLIVLVLAKASAFHIYDHHGDDLSDPETQCEFCLLAIENQQSELLLSPSDFTEENIEIKIPQVMISSIDFQVNLSPSKSDLLPRPPPSRLQ